MTRVNPLVVPVLAAGLLLGAGAVAAAGAPGSPEPRIVGGTVVDPGEYPFAAALVASYESDARDGLRCGAAMVSPEWFLTAAHCVDGYSAEAFDVVVGRERLSTADGERIAVAEIHRHPGWDRDTYSNDLALLRIAAPASVGAPAFWATPAFGETFAPGTAATVVGWGFTENAPPGTGYGTVQDDLREVAVPIRSAAECTGAYGPDFLPGSMICAGYDEGEKDACNGDSGGPLFVAAGSHWRLVGVVSWGDGCADPGFYGVYAFVAAYDAWIADTTGLRTCRGAAATIAGTSGDDVLSGTPGADVIVGGGGDDDIDAGAGDDVVCGGAGADTVAAGSGADLVFGGGGGDTIWGEWGDDELNGGAGRDALYGGGGDDLLYGYTGRDVLSGNPGSDLLIGGWRGDRIRGGNDADEILGEEGPDCIDGNTGDDLVLGGSGADVVDGGQGDDVVDGQEGPDVLRGNPGHDEILGGAGDDLILGGNGDDALVGGPGRDRLVGGDGEDTCLLGEVGFRGCETVE